MINYNMFRLLCFLAVILGAQSAVAPFIKPCKPVDKECLKASAQAAVPVVAPGIPDLGIPSLDPLHIDVVKGDTGSLKLAFRNTDVHGMKGCSVDGVKMDLVKNKQSVIIRCTVKLTGDYTLGGQLSLLPVQGEGKYTIHIRDIIIKAYTNTEEVTGEDGKPHWQFKSWHHTFAVKTSTVFQFDNLFGGNKILAEPIERFLNDNWRDVMQEVAPPIVYAIVEGVINGVAALFKAVPIDELVIL